MRLLGIICKYLEYSAWISATKLKVHIDITKPINQKKAPSVFGLFIKKKTKTEKMPIVSIRDRKNSKLVN